MFNKLIASTLAVICISALFLGCPSDEQRLADLPAPIYNDDPMSAAAARRSLPIERFTAYQKVLLFDRQYIGIKFEHLENYTKWFTKLTWAMGIGHSVESYDCDNFAFMYKSLLSISSYKNWNTNAKHKDKQILVGTLLVYQTNSFGRIKGTKDSKHALNIVHTEKGWIVVEPQTGAWIEFEKYPNRDHIIKIIF